MPALRDNRNSITAPHRGQYSTSPVARPLSSPRWQLEQSFASGKAAIRSAAIGWPQPSQRRASGQSPSSEQTAASRPWWPQSGQTSSVAMPLRISCMISSSGRWSRRSRPADCSHRATASSPQSSDHAQAEQRNCKKSSSRSITQSPGSLSKTDHGSGRSLNSKGISAFTSAAGVL